MKKIKLCVTLFILLFFFILLKITSYAKTNSKDL